jgi:hypothetical protein
VVGWGSVVEARVPQMCNVEAEEQSKSNIRKMRSWQQHRRIRVRHIVYKCRSNIIQRNKRYYHASSNQVTAGVSPVEAQYRAVWIPRAPRKLR